MVFYYAHNFSVYEAHEKGRAVLIRKFRGSNAVQEAEDYADKLNKQRKQ